ncbi:cof-like hydrolase [Candidatus Scalindua japonica]|uniref:Cof-like hydrolase n=1 Tax=Candidatus Scalindua japonica TaxID=1284222 RepID=A0A286TX93_9BACT|nr:hypothetical protein [Candidatus Scalindua japonica]GAX60484.1 cof-like hydrolase [Candidatus Scalindua japonica]
MAPSTKDPGNNTIKHDGGWVKKGDIIATKPYILSPGDGQITMTGDYESQCIWKSGVDWPQNPLYGSDDERKRTTKVKIRPVKGAQISVNLVSEAYQNTISLIEESLPPKRGTPLMGYKNQTPSDQWDRYMKTVSEALQILKNTEHKILPENTSDPYGTPEAKHHQ